MGVRKARLVMDLVRGRTASQALDTLANDNHRASVYVRKVLASAVANALQNPDVRASRLVVSFAVASDGPLLQGRMRFRPSAMGRALPFRRRTCHIHIKVADPGLTATDESEETTEESPETPQVEESTEATDTEATDTEATDTEATDTEATDTEETDADDSAEKDQE
jgi:large subunit ribosomal protein L22